MKKQKIFDVSLPIHKGMVIYPNNPGYSVIPRRTKFSYLSEITLGSHTGTHLDVPRHVFRNGVGVEKVALERTVGQCRVLDMTRVKGCIKVSDLKKCNIKSGERILVKTSNSRRGFKKFYADYVYLDGDAAKFLADKKILCFGTDYLSVKQRGSEDNRPHTELLKKGIVIFEGLNFKNVNPGKYFMVGLPLKFVGLDGAPSRVVLMEGGDNW